MAFFDDLDNLLDGAKTATSKLDTIANSIKNVGTGAGTTTPSLNDSITTSSTGNFIPPVLKGGGFDFKNPLNIALVVGVYLVVKKVL